MGRTNRRQHVQQVAWGIAGCSAGAYSLASASLLLPRVRFEAPSEVVVGRPEDYRVGEVSERFRASHKIVIVREETGIYALLSVCTHLGCIARWQAGQDKFKCFCHGSGFRKSGENFEGPAPRPLERLNIRLDAEGQIVVDTAVRYRKELGEWDSEGALLASGGGYRDE
jgi:cytochrome b6-f complex iron-sulfur subunit